MTEVETRWGRWVGFGGAASMILVLGAVAWLPFELRDGIAEDIQRSSTEGLEAAPAPNLPGRLDGNSVGMANNVRRAEVVERWILVGDRIKSGSMSRIPGDSETPSSGNRDDSQEGAP